MDDKVFAEVINAGFQIVPIISFHQCGGGPSDDVNIDMPHWHSVVVSSENKDPHDHLYQSETGKESSDAIPPWVAEEVPALYVEMSKFIDRFLKQYNKELLEKRFPEINISLRPTGELRETGWPIRVHFTALEMDDDSVDCSWPKDDEKTSMAYSLVNAVGRTASNLSILLSGENTLPNISTDDSPYDIRTWEYIRKAFDTGYFFGFTLLRLCRGDWDIDKDSLRKFVQDYDLKSPGKRLTRKLAPQMSGGKLFPKEHLIYSR